MVQQAMQGYNIVKDKGAGTYNPSLGLHTLPLTYGPKCAYWFDDYGSTNG